MPGLERYCFCSGICLALFLFYDVDAGPARDFFASTLLLRFKNVNNQTAYQPATAGPTRGVNVSASARMRRRPGRTKGRRRKRLSVTHWYRRASTGSTLVARRDGVSQAARSTIVTLRTQRFVG